MRIEIKRAYEQPSDGDGFRVLVDRLWPRGVSKEKLKADLWAKDIAPSSELRKEFGHDPGKFPWFTEQYTKELDSNPAAKDLLENLKGKEKVTLLFGAKDTQHNNAVVLKDWVKKRLTE